MDSTPGNSAPDLATILATLSRYSGQGTSLQAESDRPRNDQSKPGSSTDEVASHSAVQASQAAATLEIRDPRRQPQTRQDIPPRPTVDPASITTWQEGLRCVTKIAAQSPHFAPRIQRMMASQRSKELQWYAERQELKKRQANRSTSSAKAASILQTLSSDDTNALSLTTPTQESEENAKIAELAAFDRRIYDGLQAMEGRMSAELKSLGVPFFGTKDDLVIDDGHDVSQVPDQEGRPSWSPIVTQSDLMRLRRKMVGHLEDLYRE